LVEKKQKRTKNKGLCSIHKKGDLIIHVIFEDPSLPYLVMTMIRTYNVMMLWWKWHWPSSTVLLKIQTDWC